MDEEPANIEDMEDQEIRTEENNEVIEVWEEVQKKTSLAELTEEMMKLLRNVNGVFKMLQNEDKERNLSDCQDGDPEINLVSENELEETNSNITVEIDEGPCEVTEVLPEQDNDTNLSQKYDPDTVMSIEEVQSESSAKISSNIQEILKLRKVNQQLGLVIENVLVLLEKKQSELTNEESQELAAKSSCSETGIVDITEQDEPEKDHEMPEKEEDSQEPELDTPDSEGLEKTDHEKSEAEDISSEAITTDDDLPSQASSKAEGDRPINCSVVLKEHLKNTMKLSLQKIGKEGPKHAATFRFRCHVGELNTVGIGSKQKTAKNDAACRMIQLIVRKQEEGSLSEDIPPFSNQELEKLAPLLDSENENYVNKLQHKCHELHINMPVYAMLNEESCGNFVIQCTLKNLTTTGKGSYKKLARKLAAKEMLYRLERESVKSEEEETI